METVAQATQSAVVTKAEEHIRSSLEATVKELFPDREEAWQTAIVNATHDAFCLRGSVRNSGLDKLTALGITVHADQRALENAADQVMGELHKQGHTALDISAIQMLHWSE